jgi:hypothetical protein
MVARVAEQELAGLRWIVLRGPACGALRALGAHARAEIREVVNGWPGLARLRRHAASPPGRERLAAVGKASEAVYPEIWDELAALAEGAGVPLADLALLNLRGDIGAVDLGGLADGRNGTEDGTGCSDLAWRRRCSVIAHNEDDDLFFAGRCALLTLALDGLPPVAAFWKAGFLPSTTISVTGTGLVWSIDHLPVDRPGPGAGRHFVARGLQRTAATVDQVVGYLREHPSAGGFSYLAGDRAGRVAVVETAAGRHAFREAAADSPLTWHTNHGRYLPGAQASPGGSSEARGEVLAALTPPAEEPAATWFLRVLAGAAPPAGVRADPSGGQPIATLCTFVADLTCGNLTVLPRGGAAATVALDRLTHVQRRTG